MDIHEIFFFYLDKGNMVKIIETEGIIKSQPNFSHVNKNPDSRILV